MRDWDIEIIFHQLIEPGLSLIDARPDDFKKIDSFLTAYEMGAMGECKFRGALVKNIADKYGVPYTIDGLLKQLQKASKKAGQEISEFLKNESMEILVAASDKDNRNAFVNIKRKQMIAHIEGFPEKINIMWVANLSMYIRAVQEWKGVNLTEEELTQSVRLRDEINQVIGRDIMALTAVPKHIVQLKDELLGKLKEYVK